MNNSYNALRNITSFRNTGKSQPISGIELMVDEKNMYFAGNDDGYVMTIECPYGTQQMANDLLAKAKGFEYQGFTAEQVVLPPEAELGDGVTVAGVYGMVARRSFSFTPGMTSNIEAPRELEVQHEYKYSSPQQRKTERQIAETRSTLTKTAEEITLKVTGVDSRVTALSVTVNGIDTKVTGVDQRVTSLSATVEGVQVHMTNIDGDITSINASLSGIQTQVSGKIDGNAAQTLIDQSIDKIELSVSSGSSGSTFTLKSGSTTLSTDTLDLHVKAANIDGTLRANQIQTSSIYVGDLADGSKYATKTYVQNNAGLDANEVDDAIQTYIDSTSITAETLRGRRVNLLANNSTTVGVIEIIDTMTGVGVGIYTNQNQGGIKIESAGNVFISSAYETMLQLDEDAAKIGPTVWASDGHVIYSSDKNVKNSIEYDLSKYRQFLLDLKPCRFKFNDGQSGRYHLGVIAQDVEQSLADNGITPEEFSGWCKAPIRNKEKEITGYTYGIRYDSFIPLNIMLIQELFRRVEKLEERR